MSSYRDRSVRPGSVAALGSLSVAPARRLVAVSALERRWRGRAGATLDVPARIASSRRHFWLKRVVDIVVALAGAAFYLPIIALAGLAILTIDPGPVFYSQRREGQYGRSIRVWKLRTMYGDAGARLERHIAADPAARAEWHRHFKLRDDPRVLPWIGAFLRQSSIDELPQIWNLLRGDMTLVGPRPLPEYHLKAYDTGFRRLRQHVVPGLTGLWQVSGRSDGDIGTMRRLDCYYLEHQSFALDARILLRTVAVVLSGRGAR